MVSTPRRNAFAKSQTGAYGSLPTSGKVFVFVGQPGQARDDLPGEGGWPTSLRVLATAGTGRG